MSSIYNHNCQRAKEARLGKMFEKKPLSKKARKKNKQILQDWDHLYVMPPDSVK